jgi:hypothetical protein
MKIIGADPLDQQVLRFFVVDIDNAMHLPGRDLGVVARQQARLALRLAGLDLDGAVQADEEVSDLSVAMPVGGAAFVHFHDADQDVVGFEDLSTVHGAYPDYI